MAQINFLNKIKEFFLQRDKSDNLERIEEILLEADISVDLVEKILNKLKEKSIKEYQDFIAELKNLIYMILADNQTNTFYENELNVILIVGVNGVGKTTTCAKLAKKFLNKNKKVLLVAADTFRAAAIEQIEKLAQMIKTDIIKGEPGADPASVVFDSMQKAKKSKLDFVIVDTAGRLHNKFNLMQELNKIQKVILKEINSKNLFSLIVLDSNTGKNMLNQVKEFNEKLKISGIILTKFDSMSKAGSLLSIKNELKIPIKYLGCGENMEDIIEFTPEIYIKKFFDIN